MTIKNIRAYIRTNWEHRADQHTQNGELYPYGKAINEIRNTAIYHANKLGISVDKFLTEVAEVEDLGI